MRIALVTETFLPSTDGIVTRLTHAIDYMLRQGHDVLVIAPDIEGLPENYKGAKVMGSKAITFFFYKERPWAIPNPKITDWIEDFQADIIHAVNPFSLSASAVGAAKKLGIPLINSYHTNIPDYLSHYNFDLLKPIVWKYIRDLHNQAPINLVTSQAMYDELDKQDIQGLQILPKGVDTVYHDPSKYRSEMRHRLSEGDTDKSLLIFVGRLAPEKQIDSLRSIFDERSDIRLAIIGDGPAREDLEKLFEDTATVFTGYLHGEELAQAYASADAFVFPSTTETLGLVILEAMASGTPVIAAYSPPTAEQVTDGVNGLMYDQKSVQSLSHAIERLENPDFKESLQKEARNYAEQFLWDKASQAILDAYEETLRIYHR